MASFSTFIWKQCGYQIDKTMGVDEFSWKELQVYDLILPGQYAFLTAFPLVPLSKSTWLEFHHFKIQIIFSLRNL